MRRRVNLHSLLSARTVPEPRIPRRWKLFITLSTASLLALAGAIALWLPEYRAVAWALVLFGACHASFLVAQRVGCKPAARPGRTLDSAAGRGDAAPLP
jgi:hypothetical protein